MNRDELLTALGEWPQKTALEPTILEAVDCGSYIREKVEYSVEEGERVCAYLCIPHQRAVNAPAVFCHHQHDWDFRLGKSEVVGLAGHPDQHYAAELAERGYITFAPDCLGFEERNWSEGSFESSYFELTSRLVAGRTLLAKVLHDASVGIDYLVTRKDVDVTSIGFLGHSYGGRMALWLPAFDRRIRASVSNCGCVTYRESLRRDAGIQMEFCVPGITALGDIEDIAALVAPTPLYISAAADDRWSRGAEALFHAARPYFPADALQLRIWPGDHAFPPPMREAAYCFLDRHLLASAPAVFGP